MRLFAIPILLSVLSFSVFAQEPEPAQRPVIALIIDDLGHAQASGRRVVALNGPVAVAVLPHTPHAQSLARDAARTGKEVLLHQPFAAVDVRADPGPGAIGLHISRVRFARTLSENLDSVPHAVGVSSHMGSLITRHPGHMRWLMEELRLRGDLYFVDSRTTAHSVADTLAREHGVPVVRRDVFVDAAPDAASIAREFARLKVRARERGAALGIAHPYPETLSFLERALPALAEEGFELVPVAELVRRENGGQTWHASSFPSLKASRNSRLSP